MPGREERGVQKGKYGSIRKLLGAMEEAENRLFYDEKSEALNDLESLLKIFLYKDDSQIGRAHV